jgi:hypothetical protein
MSNELSTAENIVEELFIKLMTERVMSMFTGIQTSSTRGIPTYPSTAHGAGPSRSSDEKRTKNRDDLENSKPIPTILPTYIPTLSSVVNRDNIPRDFKYALVTTYLPKGIQAVRENQDKIITLKFSHFNLGDRKVYNMLAPHKYMTRTKGKNSKVIPQAWTHNLA